jgi:hypothetical protein
VIGELSSLLERACELEPGRFIRHERDMAGSRRWSIKKFGMDVVLHEATLNVRLGDIQVAVQEAIRAKGMRYQLGGYFHSDQGRAIVWPDELSLIESDACYGHDPDGRDAVALLSAFLAAVEAAKETT